MIGLFFGDTDFPKLILKKLKKTKKKYLILDLSRKNIFKKDSNSFRVKYRTVWIYFKIVERKEM